MPPTIEHFSISIHGETYLPAVNRQIFEAQTSSQYYAQNFPELLTTEGQLTIIVGLDSGLLANYLLDHALANDSKFIFVELAYVLDVLNIDIPQHLTDKITVITQEQLTSTLANSSHHLFVIKNKVNVLLSAGAKTAYLNDYYQLATQVTQTVEQVFFDNSAQLNQGNFIHQQFNNLFDNQYPLSLVKDKFKQSSCIVVGAAPSLDEHLNWLKENQHKFWIIAVSRVAYQLYAKGVVADFVVAVDPQEVCFTVSKDIFKLPKRCILLNADHLVSSITAQWHSDKFYVGCQFPWEETASNCHAEGPTVSNTAISNAAYMGFSHIFLLGVDLCWSAQGVSHTQGSTEGKLGPDITKIGQWVNTYNGEKAETTAQMAVALAALELQASQLSHKTSIINLSCHAAIAKGVAHQKPEEINIGIDIDKAKKRSDIQQPKINKNYNQFIDTTLVKLAAANSEFETINQLATKGITLVKQLPKTNHQLEELEQKLMTKHKQLLKFIKFYGYAEFAKFLSTKSEDNWQQQDIIQMNLAYYQAIQVTSHQIKQAIEQAIVQGRMRLEELTPNANLTQLTEYWLSQKQPGRVEFWLQKHNKQTLTQPMEKQIDSLRQAFNQMQQRKLTVKNQQNSQNWSLKTVPAKIDYLYRSKNTRGLAQLVSALTNYPKSTTAKRLCARAHSYLYEIKGQYQQAFKVLDELADNILSEPEWKQLTLMAIKQQDLSAAEHYLHKLLPITEQYQPKLAQIQKLQHKYGAAAETYLAYLTQYPQDYLVWCQFGEMLAQVGETDAAIEAFNHALTAKPDYLLAADYLNQLTDKQNID